MARVWVAAIVATVVVIALVLLFIRTRKPKPTVFDDPLYQRMAVFVREVAYYNDILPLTAIEGRVPEELARNARILLDSHRKGIRSNAKADVS